jgi:hypothetical protein
VFTRRDVGLVAALLMPVYLSKPSRAAEINRLYTVRIRADETVRGVLPPIALRNLTMELDQSVLAREMAARAPPERAVPVILIIIGALALTQIVQLIHELVRQYYYGGVVVDGRKSPPEISNDPKIPANMVIVFSSDGTVKQFSSGNLPLNLLESVMKAGK